MPKNLTPVVQYTGNVTVPVGGDARTAASVETPIQTLTDRAAYCKAQLDARDQFAMFDITGTGVGSGDKVTLTELLDQSGVYSIASDEIVMPAIGKYEVAWYAMVLSSDTTDPQTIGLQLRRNSGVTVVQDATTKRYSATAADHVLIASTLIFDCTNLSTHTLSLHAALTGGTMTVQTGKLTIRRLTT